MKLQNTVLGYIVIVRLNMLAGASRLFKCGEFHSKLAIP